MEPQIGDSSTATSNYEQWRQELKDKGVWRPEKLRDILDKMNKIKWSPTMSCDDIKRNVQDVQRSINNLVTWTTEDAIERKDTTEVKELFKLLLAQRDKFKRLYLEGKFKLPLQLGSFTNFK